MTKDATNPTVWLGNRSVVEGHGIGLSCHHCGVSWGGCAAECCCPQCGATKGYHDHDWGRCYCSECEQAAMRGALCRILSLRRQILIDVGAKHADRMKTADERTIEMDADFRRELESAFEEITKATGADQ